MRATSWIAMLAMVAATLAPLVSHALAAARSPTLPADEICSIFGVQHADARFSGHDSGTPEPVGSAERARCPLCLPAASPTVLASPHAAVLACVADNAPRLVAHVLAWVFEADVFARALPRAPPFLA
jgi:hypothetical protein